MRRTNRSRALHGFLRSTSTQAHARVGHLLDIARMDAQTMATRNGGRPGDGKTGKEGSNGRPKHGSVERQGSSKLSRVLEEMSTVFQSAMSNTEASERERRLLDDNYKLRRRNARLNDELEEAQQNGVEDGQHVISDDDFKELEEFRKLKLKPADVAKVVEEHGKLAVKEGERAAEQVYVEAADALEVENPKALARLLKKENLHVEIKTEREKIDGKWTNVPVAYCRPKGDEKAQLTPLADYLEQEFPTEIIDALLTKPADTGHSDGDGDDEEAAGGRAGSSRRTLRRERNEDEIDAGANGESVVPMTRLGSGRRGGNGVPVASARGSRPTTGGRPLTDQQLEDKKRATGVYGI